MFAMFDISIKMINYTSFNLDEEECSTCNRAVVASVLEQVTPVQMLVSATVNLLHPLALIKSRSINTPFMNTQVNS
jgi:hypothetical protein